MSLTHRLAALLLSFVFSSAAAESQWKPPARPDPGQILHEAREDGLAGRHADALAKHLWYHREALAISPSHAGVRLSFALSYWGALAEKYPPARKELEAVRIETGARARTPAGTEQDFHDFQSMNRQSRNEASTLDLFLWLDQNNPAVAKASYPRAERTLISARKYELCGKYLDPDGRSGELIRDYKSHMEEAKRQRDIPADWVTGTAKGILMDRGGSLVALLVLNGRKAEADKVAEAFLKAHSDADMRKTLAAAKKGVIPRDFLAGK
jgi:hypothetical protein